MPTWMTQNDFINQTSKPEAIILPCSRLLFLLIHHSAYFNLTIMHWHQLFTLFSSIRVVQYKDQPNLEMLQIFLQSLLKVNIMKSKTSTPLKIDTWMLLLVMKLLLILNLTLRSIASILSHFRFHDITLISWISHMSLTKKKDQNFSQVFFIVTLI